MANEPKDGGPAFPIQVQEFDGIMGPGWHLRAIPGMSLLDYFAGQAMLIAGGFTLHTDSPNSPEERAAAAYRLASAMVRERNKTR